jgi:hypothetical protein
MTTAVMSVPSGFMNMREQLFVFVWMHEPQIYRGSRISLPPISSSVTALGNAIMPSLLLMKTVSVLGL